MGNNMMSVSRNASKSETAEYVAAAVEMESALMTLGDAIESCKEKKEEYKLAQESDLKDAETEFSKNKAQLEEKQRDLDFEGKRLQKSNNLKLRYWNWGLFFGVFFISLIVSYLIVAVITEEILDLGTKILDSGNKVPSFVENIPILYKISGGNGYDFYMSMFWILVFLISLISGIIAAVINVKKEKDREVFNCANKFCEVESDIISCQQNIERSRENLDAVKERIKRENEVLIPALDAQYASLCNDRKKISQTISEFYNIGIIPPDYRTMDCVIILNQIFRNDLADTMRDAIKIYEERVFRGEVIRGMDNICRNIGRLAAGMAVVESRINEIQSNVQLMSQDWNDFSNRVIYGQARQQKALDEMIQETRMSRYSAEKVAESVKNLEYYERRNQGWA